MMSIDNQERSTKLNASLIWLILKIVVALDIKDFRPTSLVVVLLVCSDSNDTSSSHKYRWKVRLQVQNLSINKNLASSVYKFLAEVPANKLQKLLGDVVKLWIWC